MPRVVLLVLLVIFFVLGGTIGYYNAQPVRFSYIFGEVEIPLIALIIGEFMVAVALTLIIVFGRVLALKSELRRLKRQLHSSEAELASLRRVALESPPGNTGSGPSR